MVVFGLYGNSTSHFELASSRHMRDSGGRCCSVSVSTGRDGWLEPASPQQLLLMFYWRGLLAAVPPLGLPGQLSCRRRPPHKPGSGVHHAVGRAGAAPEQASLPPPTCPAGRPCSPIAAAVQGTLSFALNGMVFFFAGASAVNFMVRWVEVHGRSALQCFSFPSAAAGEV